LTVTPLRLSDDRGKPCVQALWSAIRLLREGQPIMDTTSKNSNEKTNSPFEAFNGQGVELFAQAGVRDVGEVLRFGAPKLSGRELAVKALGYKATGEVMAGEPFELKPESAEGKTAYEEILREALYVHALNVVGELFDVSRVGRSGILLTAKLISGSWACTPVSDAVAVLDQYTLNIEVNDNYAQLACTLSHELRSPLTVRQILDDPSLMDLPEGAEVVALGGPHLQGRLSYAKSTWKIGEPREELKGESLVEYHRKRYPARVKLLENARNDDQAVQLVQPGRSPSAYPAELLSPVIRVAILDTQTRDAVAQLCAGSPMDLQRRITTVRSLLGQPFAPRFDVEEKMMRLTPPPSKLASFDDNVRVGDLIEGPAVMTNESTKIKVPPVTLFLGSSLKDMEHDDDGSQYAERLTEVAEKTMRSWNRASDQDISRIKDDISGAKIVWFDDTSLQSIESSLGGEFRKQLPGSTILVSTTSAAGRQVVEAGTRRASSTINSRVRIGIDDISTAKEGVRSRLCSALVTRRGGQATLFRQPIAPEGMLFVGAGTKAGMPVVDRFGKVLHRQYGAPYGSTVTDAVRTSIEMFSEIAQHLVIHHAGESDESDVAAASEMARTKEVTLDVVDIIESDCGWRKDLGVTQPEHGFWSTIGGDDSDDAIMVTTDIESNFTRGVARPLRVKRRARSRDVTIDLATVVNHIASLATVVDDGAPDHRLGKFRSPITLRPQDTLALEVILL
jgi:hypothetical protein